MCEKFFKNLSRPVSLLAFVLAAVCITWAAVIGGNFKNVVVKGPLSFLAIMSLTGLTATWVIPVLDGLLFEANHIPLHFERTCFAVVTYGMFIAWFPVYLL